MKKYIVWWLAGAFFASVPLMSAQAGLKDIGTSSEKYNCKASMRSLEESVDREVNVSQHLAILRHQWGDGKSQQRDRDYESTQ